MTTSRYIVLAVYIIILFLILNYIKTRITKNQNRKTKTIQFILEIVLTLGVSMAIISFSDRVVWHHEYLFGSLYLVLMADVFSNLISLMVSFLRKGKDDPNVRIIIGAIITLIFSISSIINMQTITANYHEIKSSKLKNEYTIVFFADLHYGSAQSKQTVDKALEEIADLKPDCLLLGGDITDEFTTKEEMEYIYQKIGSLNIRTYYIYGNHDRQDSNLLAYGREYSEEELANAIRRNNITILYDDYAQINDDLIIIGREDVSRPEKRKAVKDLPAYNKESYVITVDHNPYQNEDIIELKADLQLSGHTHAGQFFPVKTIYKLLGLNAYGDYHIGNTHLYVSSGIAGWYLPFRSEEHYNYEVIQLKPE